MLPNEAWIPAERLGEALSVPAPVLLAAFTVTVMVCEGEGLAAMLMPVHPAVVVPEPVPGPPPGQTTFVTVAPATERLALKLPVAPPPVFANPTAMLTRPAS
jgi:hypothetical protein